MARRLNVRGVLGRYGLRPKAAWSQNFLVDLDALETIAEAVEPHLHRVVVDLGAGIGALTVVLARKAERVLAVERDRDLAEVLRKEFARDPVVEILEDNAATLDFADLERSQGTKPAVVGNLPYHMATQILFHLLESRDHIAQWVLMFQKELADRLISGPGNRSYGVISVLLQRLTLIEPVLDVPPDAFYPPPKVHSRVLRFCPLSEPSVQVRDEKHFERVVKAAFGQRRKQLRNSLLAAFGATLGPQGVDHMLQMAGVAGDVRAEQLSIEMFASLADVLSSMGVE